MIISIKAATQKSDKEDSNKGGSAEVSMSRDGEPLGKVQKRTHSEVAEASVEELTLTFRSKEQTRKYETICMKCQILFFWEK